MWEPCAENMIKDMKDTYHYKHKIITKKKTKQKKKVLLISSETKYQLSYSLTLKHFCSSGLKSDITRICDVMVPLLQSGINLIAIRFRDTTSSLTQPTTILTVIGRYRLCEMVSVISC